MSTEKVSSPSGPLVRRAEGAVVEAETAAAALYADELDRHAFPVLFSEAEGLCVEADRYEACGRDAIAKAAAGGGM